MPTYVYRFVDTGETIEVQQSFADDALTEATHPETGDVHAGEEGVHPGRRHVQGRRVLQDRQPRQVEVGAAEERAVETDVDVQATRRRRRRRPRTRASKESTSTPTSSRRTLRRSEPTELVGQSDDWSGRATPEPGAVLIPIGDAALAEVGVFGGPGSTSSSTTSPRSRSTRPYGAAGGPLTVGTVTGRRVAFLPRHGREHEYAAHRVPYRANVWALASLGVRSIVGAVLGRLAAAGPRTPATSSSSTSSSIAPGAAPTRSTTSAATSTRAPRSTTSPSPTRTTPASGPCSSPPARRSA